MCDIGPTKITDSLFSGKLSIELSKIELFMYQLIPELIGQVLRVCSSSLW